VCEECGEKNAHFSREAIVKRALELPDGPKFELHRPWMDRVVLKCQKCGGRALREPFVLDAWHNSGSAPYASFTDDEFRKLVPVGFLTEAIDQTRAWAYTLLLLNVIRSGRPQAPYKAFLFQGHVLSEKGQKMSKSEGNVVWGLDVLRNNSADVARFYVMSKASPEDSVNFDLKEMSGRPYQVLNTLYHLHLYLRQNGDLDGYDPARHTVPWATRRRLLTTVDRWLLAKLSRADETVNRSFSAARFNEGAKALEELVISHLSQTYVRLVRGELWKEEAGERGRRLAIYAVLGSALRKTDELLHPVSPFATEYLYQEVFAPGAWGAPLLAIGKSRGRAARSLQAEKTVDFALKVEEACNSARMKAKLKRRWPLRSVEVLVPVSGAPLARKAKRTVALLCNVKGVGVVTSASRFPADFELRANSSRVGALFKEKTRDVLRELRPLKGGDALRAYSRGRPVKAGPFDVPLSAFELVTKSHEGFEVAEKGGVFVAIGKERDDRLVAEGLVRDVARRLQALRKESGYVPTALLAYAKVRGLEDEDLALLEPKKAEIAFLVRVKKVELAGEREQGSDWKEADLDGRPIYLKVG
jgi:isoleucyl-tRNA synthetase